MHDPTAPEGFDAAAASEATKIDAEQELSGERRKMLDSGIRWPLANEDYRPKCGNEIALHFLSELWRGRKIEYNQRLQVLEIDGRPATEAVIESKLGLLELTSRQVGWRFDHLRWASAQIARQAKHYHPIKRYLQKCRSEWDGQERIDKLVGTVIPCEDPTPLHHRSMECFFVGAVARQFEPGCQNDSVLVLQGGQGFFKSSFFITMASDRNWHTNDIGDLSNKDAKMALAQAWIIEFAEMASMKKSDVEAAKNFITTRIDKFRAPYAKSPTEQPRTCAFGATVNPGEFLNDSTGNRRYMIIPVSKAIDIEYITSIREQIWGEAVAKYRDGVKWYFSKQEEQAQAIDGQNYETEHPWMSAIHRSLMASGDDQVVKHGVNGWYVITRDLLGPKCINKPIERCSKADQMVTADCLKKLGWTKNGRANDGYRSPSFAPPPEWIPPVEQASFAGFDR